ncbi:MAG TPA: Rnase Y domain-containing protein, partial [Bacteroidia bacterium]|nr:Rnase Y domain-containing protein [Bacteroidia bacterium]
MDPIIIGVGIGAALIAAIITFLVTKKNNAVIVGAAKQQADTLLKEAEAKGEVIKKDKLLEAKEKFFQLKSEHEKAIAEKDKKISDAENRIRQKERELNQKLEQNSRKHQEYEALQTNLKSQMQIVEARKQEVDKSLQKHVQALEKIAGISQDEAKTQLMETLKAEARTQAQSYIKEIMDEAKLTANKEAKRIIIQSIQRVATEHAVENSVTVFNLENDDVKGRVIGREGRNIRALEA